MGPSEHRFLISTGRMQEINSTLHPTSYVRVEQNYDVILCLFVPSEFSFCSFGYLWFYSMGIRIWFILPDVDIFGFVVVV